MSNRKTKRRGTLALAICSGSFGAIGKIVGWATCGAVATVAAESAGVAWASICGGWAAIPAIGVYFWVLFDLAAGRFMGEWTGMGSPNTRDEPRPRPATQCTHHEQ